MMIFNIRALFMTLFVLFYLPTPISSQTQLKKILISNGSLTTEFKTYQLEVSLGQSTIGKISRDSVLAQIGFWNILMSNQPEIQHSLNRSTSSKASISQNYPNPFSRFTHFDITLSSDEIIKIFVYSMDGKMAEHPRKFEIQAGHHQLQWDGSGIQDGQYLVEFLIGDLRIVKKCVILR
jgi:hypothetical protein